MNEQLSLLIQLQEIDGRVRAHREDRKRIPEQLAEIERRIETGKAGIEQARQALEDAQKAKRDRDQDLEECGRKVEKLKTRSSEIKTNKEYQAHLKEIETAEQEGKAIEDDILKYMERIDAATAEVAAAEKRSAEESTVIGQERKQLEEDIARVERELAEEERARSELAGRIDADALAEYQRLMGQTNGKVVVEARNESCSGCYMSIPPRTFVLVKKNDGIVGCPNCHRILYYKEAVAPPAP
jgi:predicted  nucleic acid-binding Zn-ribbon protein